MEHIKFYEINENYVNYLLIYEPQLFHNSQKGQANKRKYIGIVFQINNMDYFAPLSSFKTKHEKMKEGLDFIKVQNYAVINLNNMFPVPPNQRTYVDFNAIKDTKYKSLLLGEYRIIKSIESKIRKNAAILYRHKLENGNTTQLSKRCNDFALLESVYMKYKDI